MEANKNKNDEKPVVIMGKRMKCNHTLRSEIANKRKRDAKGRFLPNTTK